MTDKPLFRAALCGVSGRPLDITANGEDMVGSIRQAEDAGALLIAFPLESLSGHTGGDLLMPGLKTLVYDTVLRVAQATGKGLCLFSFRMEAQGRQTVAVAAARDGGLWAVGFPQLDRDTIAPFLEETQKHLGSQVRVAGAPNFPIPGTGHIAGVVLSPDPLRAQRLADIGATVMVCMEAVPVTAGLRRGHAIARMSRLVPCPWLGVNAGANESTTDGVYGAERCAALSGAVLAQQAPFGAHQPLVVNLPGQSAAAEPPQDFVADPRKPYAPKDPEALAHWCREALNICAHGLATRLTRTGIQKAVLGLSGGLDSAMALLIAKKALHLAGLPPENLLGYSLPAFGTSQRTRQNALGLMDALGLERREIDVAQQVAGHLKAIGHQGQKDAAYENAQARERTQALMNLCNIHGGLMVGPGDMSELALGFTTYGGDHMSMYGVNAGLLKTAIRLILRQAARDTDNQQLKQLLEDILLTPISPELLPGGSQAQQTEHILGSYEVNDCILWHLLGGMEAPAILHQLKQAFPELESDKRKDALSRFIRRFTAAQFKRSCLPDGPQVLGRSLSPRAGLRMPSDATAAPWLEAIERS